MSVFITPDTWLTIICSITTLYPYFLITLAIYRIFWVWRAELTADSYRIIQPKLHGVFWKSHKNVRTLRFGTSFDLTHNPAELKLVPPRCVAYTHTHTHTHTCACAQNICAHSYVHIYERVHTQRNINVKKGKHTHSTCMYMNARNRGYTIVDKQ